MRMRVVYIAGPYRAADRWATAQHIRRAEAVGLVVAQFGAVPLIPHSMFSEFGGTKSDGYWLAATQELLRRCDAIVMLYGWEKSEGSVAEYELAVKLGIDVFTEESARLGMVERVE